MREWLLAGRALALEAEFSLFGQRADQTDLDNLLTELFDQMLLGLFPALPSHERPRKDRFFFDVHVRKAKVRDRMKERSLIAIGPLS